MVSYNFLPHLMNDPFTLSRYMRRDKHTSWGKFVNDNQLNALDNLQKNWMQCAHLEDSFIPDHVYRSWEEELKQDVGNPGKLTFKDVFLKLLPKAADEIFELDGNLIVVRENQLDYWQHLCKSFSPLVLGVAYLWSRRDDIDGIKQAINLNFTNTAIPSFRFPKYWKSEVADIHIHFNSGLEADYKWVKALENPGAFVNFARTTHCFGDYLSKSIIKGYSSMSNMLKIAKMNLNEITTGMYITVRQCDFNSDLARHAWNIYCCFLSLDRSNELSVEFYKFHQYLLIAGVFRQLFVVQYHQVGLKQFNLVLNVEFPFKGPFDNKKYVEQLWRQEMNSMSPFQIRKIEFRLCAGKLKNIDDYRNALKSLDEKEIVKVGFICSLTKSANNWKSDVRKIKQYITKIVGIDVAGADFVASPSEFVDAFAEIRKMKKQSPWRFTYHAGEDFFHILTGMRMIYEAVTLLELQPKDRIGHASAAGVDPRNWARCLHGVVPIKQGEYLEDLKFIKDLVKNRNIVRFRGKISEIDDYVTKELSTAKTDPNRIIKVDCFQFFDEEELRILQKELLSFLSQKSIVIEACPTSNICIGYDHSLRSYHLRTWLKWKYIQYLPVPDIVIGSDEIGVFPTNISNEYACVYEMIMMDDELKPHAKYILDDLARNSMKYTFMK